MVDYENGLNKIHYLEKPDGLAGPYHQKKLTPEKPRQCQWYGYENMEGRKKYRTEKKRKKKILYTSILYKAKWKLFEKFILEFRCNFCWNNEIPTQRNLLCSMFNVCGIIYTQLNVLLEQWTKGECENQNTNGQKWNTNDIALGVPKAFVQSRMLHISIDFNLISSTIDFLLLYLHDKKRNEPAPEVPLASQCRSFERFRY